MKKRSAEPPRKARLLRQDELAVWQQITETVSPLHPQKPSRLEDHLAASASGNDPATMLPASTDSRTAAMAIQAVKAVPRRPPSIAGLNRRETQKFSRGNVEIDGRIDLHGMSVARARPALLHFIEASRDLGRRTVLVITGKGASPFTRHTLHSADYYHAPERQGILRAELSQWLHEREFARHVIGFQPAHPRHGGGGAFYLRLRRKEAHT
ncbi:MAG: Smr/MutS family protein [Anderseniella sp.]|nr:Smr/MutS family protein [Anderseniella sp.]